MVKEKIKNLKETSAAGPDVIRPRMLKELADEIAPALVIIFQRSLQYGEVPEDWKTANVTPIFKKGSKAELESILRDKMMQHLLDNNLLNQSQHAFMPGRSR
jgi:hypothetical protein